MSNKLIYYVYAYLRSKDSATAKAGTPYYIGKGFGNRYKGKHSCPVPKDPSCVVLLETSMTELGAFAIERRLIRWFGRVDLGTGILRNLTDGGEGTAGIKRLPKTEESIAKWKESRKKNDKIPPPPSDKVRKKISVNRIGKGLGPRGPRTDADKTKISQANSGKVRTAEQNVENSIRRHKFINSVKGQELFAMMSVENSYRRWWTDGVNSKFCKDCPGTEYILGRTFKRKNKS